MLTPTRRSRLLSLVPLIALVSAACGATASPDLGAYAASPERHEPPPLDGPITPSWRAAICRGKPEGPTHIALLGTFEPLGAATPETTLVQLAWPGRSAPLALPTRPLASPSPTPVYEIRAWTAADAERADFDPGWSLVEYEAACDNPEAEAPPVTRLRRLDGTPRFPARVGDLTRAIRTQHLADVTRLVEAQGHRLVPPDPREVSPDQGPGGEARETLGGGIDSVVWQDGRVVITAHVDLVTWRRGSACPPGADNPWWRHAFGIVASVRYVRTCTASAETKGAQCVDSAPVAIPRPACPRLP